MAENRSTFAPLVAFFDEPRLRFGADDTCADLVLHNAFGIFLAESVFGTALNIAGTLRATRSIAEDLVTARIPAPPQSHPPSCSQ